MDPIICTYCQEENGWITVARHDDGTELLMCLTPRYGDGDGAFVYQCGNIIELINGVRQ